MNDNHDAAKKETSVPVLFVQGTLDMLVKPEGTWELFNELATKEKYFLAVPSEHLIFEQGQDKTSTFDKRVSNMAANWMFMTVSPDGNIFHKDQFTQNGAAHSLNMNLSDAVEHLVQGRYPQALAIMQPLVKAEPNNSEAHYWLGITYAKLRRLPEAKEEMVKALSVGSDAVHAQQANTFLLANADDSEPPTDYSTATTSAVSDTANSSSSRTETKGASVATAGAPADVTVAGSSSPASATAANSSVPPTTEIDPIIRDLAGGNPTVVAFCAKWAEQCDPIAGFFSQAKSIFGDKVKLVQIDVEDHKSESLIKAFKSWSGPHSRLFARRRAHFLDQHWQNKLYKLREGNLRYSSLTGVWSDIIDAEVRNCVVYMTTGQLFASEDRLSEAHFAEQHGERSKAEGLYKKAIEERTSAVGAADGSVGEYTHQLGRFYMVENNFKAAEETLKQALEIVEKAYYAGHAKLAPILDDLSDLYIRQEKLTEAEPFLVRQLDIVDKTMSGEHRMVYETLHKLGYVYRKLNKAADAEKLMLKALKTIDSPLGPVEEFRLDLALIYSELGKNAEADTNYRSAITGFDQRKNLPRLADALTAYGAFLGKTGSNDRAKKAEDLATKVRANAPANGQHNEDIFPATLLRA